jgi:hypothetical protein
MTATYRPIRCPHGTEIADPNWHYAIYTDGCRTAGGAPMRFWCGEDEMLKPHGVSITEGEYLRDWSEALLMDHDAVWETGTSVAAFEAAHAEALILNEGDELYDEAVRLNEMDRKLREFALTGAHATELDICGWCGGLAVLNKRSACESCAPKAAEHAWYLGEVPWSDRVDD